jgi:hypothetical protein
VHHTPLHRQVIPWAARANVGVVHRADNWLEWRWITVRQQTTRADHGVTLESATVIGHSWPSVPGCVAGSHTKGFDDVAMRAWVHTSLIDVLSLKRSWDSLQMIGRTYT